MAAKTEEGLWADLTREEWSELVGLGGCAGFDGRLRGKVCWGVGGKVLLTLFFAGAGRPRWGAFFLPSPVRVVA